MTVDLWTIRPNLIDVAGYQFLAAEVLGAIVNKLLPVP
jgi:hypothetical protein